MMDGREYVSVAWRPALSRSLHFRLHWQSESASKCGKRANSGLICAARDGRVVNGGGLEN